MSSDSSLGSTMFDTQQTNGSGSGSDNNGNNNGSGNYAPTYIPGSNGGYSNTPTYSNQYPNDSTNMNSIGIRDKYDSGAGLSQTNASDIQITTVEHTLIVDTRDCIGMQSLEDAQAAIEFNGVRTDARGFLINATNTTPIVITLDSVLNLKNGDNIYINGVSGNLNTNGVQTLGSVTITNSPIGTAVLLGSRGSGAYNGGGEWYREPDPGYPFMGPQDSIVRGNQIIVSLNRPLKDIRTLALYHIVIPRDIIPLSVYITDFITVSTTYNNVSYPGLTDTDFTTFIPQEEIYLESRMLGFYSSPLDIWRSFIQGSMSMPDQITPPPHELWNPPLGDWPLQPIPYPFQTVPTYKSNSFTVTNETAFFHIIMAGYGVYDLIDWTANTGNPELDAINTSLMRKLLFFLIVPKQSYRDVDYIDLIINCNTVTPGNLAYPFGYGDFQRFVPGPGIQQNYQPGTNITIVGDPTVAGVDNPVPFPNFRGNVNGPYNYPGARFQKLGVTTLIQDLYLNGDLNNLFGEPIVLKDIPTEAFSEHPSFGLNFLSQIEVNLGNISTAINLNILNAMRIMPNGFGAATIRANGQDNTMYTSVYGINTTLGGAGGQGPSTLGVPSAWVNHGLYSSTGIFGDPIAQGPFALGITPPATDPTYPGTGSIEITHNTSFSDLGTNFGSFIGNILKYVEYAVNDIPDTDLVIKIDEAERTSRVQSTNSTNGIAILDCPIRLNTGTTNGTQQYIESISGLVAGASYYSEKRYMIPRPKLNKLHINFTTYENQPIPLEKMLQQRKSLELQRLTVKILNELNYETNPFNVNYLFDKYDPKMTKRYKRYFQIIFKINCYEAVAPGLLPSSYQGIAPYMDATNEVRPYS